jgi:TonB-linked SusC/RagA family outer membrane protein
MKKIKYLMFLLALFMATAAFSQQKKVTLSLKNVTVKTALEALKAQSGLSYWINANDVDMQKVISVNLKSKTVEDALKTILQGQDVRYQLSGDHIVISKATRVVEPKQEKAAPSGEMRKITGKVTDEKGQPLPGVTVVIQGTTKGTISDANGNYTLQNVSPNETLEFSFVGMQKSMALVGDHSVINVTMKESATGLNEVVVVGYGTQRKVTLTGAVSSVQGSDITTTQSQDLSNMLSGKLAGVNIVQNTSEPGTFSNSFQIRGFGSPLIVIDGVPRSNMDQIDPNDIASVSVLKDASAAIYGVRAANGVVLITTKQGKGGKINITYNGSVGLQVPSGMPQSMDAVGYMTFMNQRSMNNFYGGNIMYSAADMKPYIDGTKQSTDWYHAVMKNSAPQSQQDISFQGSTNNTNYFVSAGWTTQNGFLQSGSLNYHKYNVRSNITSNITKRLKVSLKISAIMDQKNQPYQSPWWIIRSIWRQIPIESIYANNTPGNYQYTSVDGSNPVAMADANVSGFQQYNNKWFQSSLSFDYQIPGIDGLTAHGMYSYDYSMSDNTSFQKQYNTYTYNAANSSYTTFAQQSPNQLLRQYFSSPSALSQISLNYKQSFGGNNIDAMALYEEQENSSDDFYAQRDLTIPLPELMAGNSLNQIGSMYPANLWKTANKGLVGRIRYDYDTKYIAEFSCRYDGSSKFAPGHQWGFFPDVSAGWRVSDEKFWSNNKNLAFIDNFKIRASWGELGDDNASSYQFVSGYNYPATDGGGNNRQPPGSVFNGSFVNSVQPLGIPNTQLTWFISKTTDLGIDADAWRGLLGVQFDFFQRDRSGLLGTLLQSLPGIVGASLPQVNLNSDRTQGWEIALSHTNHFGEFFYTINGNISYSRTQNRTIVQAKAGNSYLNWHNNSNNRYNDAWWGYTIIGQYQSYNQIANSPTAVNTTLPGDYIYQDWNGDGVINGLDVHPIAYHNPPRITYGLTFDLKYKNVDMNFLVQGANEVYVSYPEQLSQAGWGASNANALTYFANSWHPADPTANPYDRNTTWIAGQYSYLGNPADPNSTVEVHNAAYTRLKSMELGYTLPKFIVAKLGIQNFRIFLNGYDILTLSGLKFVDPEHPSGNYGYTYPLNKTYNIGVNIKF